MKDMVQFSPFNSAEINMKNPLNMNSKINFGQLTVLCGNNGSGKSFFMKLHWLANFYFNYMIIEKNQKRILAEMLELKKEDIEKMNFEKLDPTEFLQFCFETTYDGIEEFDIEAKFDAREQFLNFVEYGFNFKMKNGKIEEVNLDIPDNLLPSGPVCYLSNTMRNFNRIEQYLMMKKLLGVNNDLSFEDMKKLSDHFKLYEIITMEYMLHNIFNTNKLTSSEAGQNLVGLMPDVFEKYKDMEIVFDEAKSKFYFKSEDKKIALTSLSAGEQSILTMVFAV